MKATALPSSARQNADVLDSILALDAHVVLLVTIGVAVLLRVGSAIFQSDTIIDMPGVQDQVSYDALARRVLGGHGFSFATDWWPATRADAPTAHWSYLYTLYLSAVYSIAGVHPLAARLVQAVLAGILYPLFAWRITKRLFGAQLGLLAAMLISVYAYFIFYAGALMTETFYILALLWAVDVAMRIGVGPIAGSRGEFGARESSRMRVWSWVQLGLALGAAILLRQLLFIVVPVVAGWLLVSRGRARWKSTLVGLAMVITVMGLLIAPWTARNYAAFGRFVLLNTNAGYAFFWGNHPIHGTNFISILPSQVYHDLIPQELRSLDEAALESALMTRGIGFVMDDPMRYAVLSLGRIKDYFEFWPSSESGALSNISRVLSFGLYLPLMLFGLWQGISRREQLVVQGQAAPAVLLYLFVAAYTMIHLLSWALVRYRLPVDAFLMPFAALGAQQLVLRLATKQSLPKPPADPVME